MPQFQITPLLPQFQGIVLSYLPLHIDSEWIRSNNLLGINFLKILILELTRPKQWMLPPNYTCQEKLTTYHLLLLLISPLSTFQEHPRDNNHYAPEREHQRRHQREPSDRAPPGPPGRHLSVIIQAHLHRRNYAESGAVRWPSARLSVPNHPPNDQSRAREREGEWERIWVRCVCVFVCVLSRIVKEPENSDHSAVGRDCIAFCETYGERFIWNGNQVQRHCPRTMKSRSVARWRWPKKASADFSSEQVSNSLELNWFF